MIHDLPIFGVCGWSGAGKTTLIEGIVPILRGGGLAVAVVKHDAHSIDVDRPGKDSDRLFRSGGDVLLQGPGEQLLRTHTTGDGELPWTLQFLAERHDVVLVEGHKGTPIRKVWLLGEGEASAPEGVENVAAVVPRNGDRVAAVVPLLLDHVEHQWRRTPVYGCVVTGGRSGEAVLARTVARLRELTSLVVIAGASEACERLRRCVRLPAVPDARGPLAALLAAMRWDPRASWLVSSPGLPEPSAGVLEWLLSTRRPGVWATLPTYAAAGAAAPLPAHYDPRCRLLLARLAARGPFRLADVASSPKVATPTVPSRRWRAQLPTATPAAHP
jgi:molybdopterin-guanine dinucleotide biosynthesis protein B